MAIAQVVFSFLNQAFLIGIGVLGIGFLVVFHEFGHLIFCKIFGVKVHSFSIGMGPKLIKKKIGETEYSLSAIPIGGYVEIAGQDPDEELEISEKKNLFTQKLNVILKRRF